MTSLKKFIFLVVLLFGQSFYCTAQVLEVPWILIKATRIDGSKIIQRSQYEVRFGYTFYKDKVIVTDTIDYTRSILPYGTQLLDATHATNFFQDLELLGDTILMVTEKHQEGELDKKNRYFLLRKDSYIEYIRSSDQFVLINDSTILANSYLFPIPDLKNRNSSFSIFINDWISPVKGALSGYIILNKDKKVSKVELLESRKFDQWQRLERALKSKSIIWDVPIEGYAYKIGFTIITFPEKDKIIFSFRPFDFNKVLSDGKSGEEYRQIQKYYDEGIALAKDSNYSESIISFTKCIEMDSIFLDAYYNRAFVYFDSQQKEKACKDWGYLKDLEQVTATALFTEHCIEN